MTYEAAKYLLSFGKVSGIRRKAWEAVDETACLYTVGENDVRPLIMFGAAGDMSYRNSSWSGTQEDRDATDWRPTPQYKLRGNDLGFMFVKLR